MNRGSNPVPRHGQSGIASTIGFVKQEMGNVVFKWILTMCGMYNRIVWEGGKVNCWQWSGAHVIFHKVKHGTL